MAERKKEFFGLEVLLFTLLYLRPEGRRENSLCWGVDEAGLRLRGWRRLSCRLCAGRCSAERAEESR